MSKFLMPILLPVIVGPLTFLVMQGLKAVSATIDALPPVAKRIAVLVTASLLTMLGAWSGVDLSCDPAVTDNCLANLSEDSIKAVVGAVLAFLLHYGKQKKG